MPEYEPDPATAFEGIDDDEDEFGLPSIATSRRAARRAGGPSLELGDESRKVLEKEIGQLNIRSTGPRARANSSDIAEERGPIYPSAKKSEGKILRPQYKEILKGFISSSTYYYPLMLIRSDECVTYHNSSCNTAQRIK